MNSSELERAEDAACDAQRAAAGRRRADATTETQAGASGAQSAGEWIARWEQLSPGQRHEWAERIVANEARVARVEALCEEAWLDGRHNIAHDFVDASRIRAALTGDHR